ncbi:L2 protein [Phocoena phocoena papillomavirus 1]|uniref:Minor capsid protein L2 n=1 Tax=Phocoena phocoena papillomavirus 1 TaxID=706525 RepID=F2VIR0_PSPV|nr:L2 protein [Phocoena phocoena papillomavirus 1]ADJ96345.1 L2 protein [Phocoena phocoena papillomavirus 1]
MVKARRKKRAAEGDLYAGCRGGQDCPDDIRRKFEQDTWADRFLKWFSSFIYLGNLGISTGRGSGGTSAYVPLGGRGGTGRPAMGGQPSRPNVLVDNVGPAEVPGTGSVDASAPSVVVPSESTVVVEGGATPHEEIPLLPLHPDVPPVNPDHTVLDPSVHVVPPPESGGPAILDISLSTSTHDPSILHPSPPSAAPDVLFPTISLQPLDVSLLPGESSFTPHTVISSRGGFEDGFEDIELDVFDGSPGTPRESTPLSGVRGAHTRRAGVLKKFYHRLTQQVKVSKPDFLRQPSRLVSFEFDNAAFDPDVTLQFQQPSHDVLQAPDPDFQDVGTLHKPVYSIEGGHVRVSRYGVRETIRTRLGTAIGARVHFFTDLSSIGSLSAADLTTSSLGPDLPDPGIELQLFGESSGDTSIADAQNGGIVLQNGGLHDSMHSAGVIDGAVQSLYSEDMLLDNYSDTFDHGHLAMMDRRSSSVHTVSFPQLARPARGFAESTGGLSVTYPVSHKRDTSTPSESFIDSVPGPPLIVLFEPGFGPSFYLHPSLLRKKRKRVFY